MENSRNRTLNLQEKKLLALKNTCIFSHCANTISDLEETTRNSQTTNRMKRNVRKLSNQEIEEKLSVNTKCQYREGQLEMELDFGTYLEGVGFANRVAEIAESLDHHPEITIGYKKVRIHVFTHSHSSITNLDFELMEQIAALA